MKKRSGPRKSKSKLRRAKAALRAFALAYPGAREEFPWGERVIKVGKKVFLFLGAPEGDELGLSVKLPATASIALLFPFATPTGYGLGKAGWVSAEFAPGHNIPLAMLRQWIDESYRAVAPRTKTKTAARTEGPGVSGAARRTGPRDRRPSGKKSSRSTARAR
jgi:predicted DNA-binding protein (MmcQ/YjbR family)